MAQNSADCLENSDVEDLDHESDAYSEEYDDGYYHDLDPAEFYRENQVDGVAGNGEDEINPLPHMLHRQLVEDVLTFRSLLEPLEAPRIRNQLEGLSVRNSTRPKVVPLLCVRSLEALDEVDLDIHVPLMDLGITLTTARAWGLNMDEALIIRMNLMARSYLDGQALPKISVFQLNQKERSVTTQIRNLLTLLLERVWKTLDNDRLQSTRKTSCSVSCGLFSAAGSTVKKKKSALSVVKQIKCLFSKKRGRLEDGVDTAALQKVMEMGFPEQESRQALKKTQNNLVDASLLLASQNDSPSEEASSLPFRVKKLTVTSSKKRLGKTERQKRRLSTPEKSSKTTKDFSRSRSTSDMEPSVSEESSNPLSVPPAPVVDIKAMPCLDDGFLVMMYRYVRQRLPRLSEFCVMCDNYHVFRSTNTMLKPCVCSRQLCLFSFQALGVMSDAMADIATDTDVVDLLVTMAKAACSSNRKGHIFLPYPIVLDPACPESGRLALSDKNKDYKLVQKLLETLPPLSDMLLGSPNDLQTTLDKRNTLLYPLLSWIVYSNRSHIMKLPEAHQLKMMSTPHQFILLSSPPAEEKVFQEAKKKYGSCFAFHGSPIENWHSIIRQGLVVASGTHLQMHGAAQGRGIYLSPSADVSGGYAKLDRPRVQVRLPRPALHYVPLHRRFFEGRKVACIALCEVIDSNHLKKTGEAWVCTEESHVCTRFLFVFEEDHVFYRNVSVKDSAFQEQLQQALDNSFMAVVPRDATDEQGSVSNENTENNLV